MGVRTGVVEIPSGDWAFANCATTPFPGTPDETMICLRNGFDPNLIYELVYTAKDPLVLGVGMAAMRDVVSFFRRASAADGNPIAGKTNWVIGYGISQSGRYTKNLILLGFNEDEDGRIVWDGAHPIIGGSIGQFNIRFAQPGYIANIFEPGAEGPIWWGDYNDKARGRGVTGILQRCRATHTCPKIFDDFGGAEVWYGRGGVGIAGTRGREDIPLPRNVRRYYNASTDHGGGDGGFSRHAAPATRIGAGRESEPPDRNAACAVRCADRVGDEGQAAAAQRIPAGERRDSGARDRKGNALAKDPRRSDARQRHERPHGL